VPYNASQQVALEAYIPRHNALEPSPLFVAHVGDIKAYDDPCDSELFGGVATTLGVFDVPVLMVPGDNEYNDCDDPPAALALWRTTFIPLAEGMPGAVARQDVRSENFAFVEGGVLFVGVNVVGGSVHDAKEWAQRLDEDADWLEARFVEHAAVIDAAVVISHATLGEGHGEFLTRFRAASATLNKPVLYLQGDEHDWNFDRPWAEQNIQRMSVDGGSADPVVVSVHREGETFRFDQTPFE